MNDTKKIILIILKLLASITVFFILKMIIGSLFFPLFGVDLSGFQLPDIEKLITSSIVISTIDVLIITFFICKSKWYGIKLILTISFVVLGITSLLNLFESLIFLNRIMPINLQLASFCGDVLITIVMSFFMIFIFGKLKKQNVETKLVLKKNKFLIIKWAVLIIIWFVIYYSAGSSIAMQVDEVTIYYFGVDKVDGSNYSTAKGAMDVSNVWIGFLLQILRGTIWILIAIPLIKMTKGSYWEISMGIGLLFGLLMSDLLLMPNFIMPDIIRLAHLPEIMFANLLWGIILTWILKSSFEEVKV